MSIDQIGITVHRKWLRTHKNGYAPVVQHRTLLEALSDARKGMKRTERVEHLINTILRGLDDIRILD